MLNSIIVQGTNPLTIPVTDVDPSAMLVLKSITGLTSGKVGLYTGDFATEGSYYQGRRAERIMPVMTFKMNPNYATDLALSDIRETLYRAFFQPQPGIDGVTVTLKDDRKPDRFFTGYTEAFETDQFSQSRDVQVSMQTLQGYLLSVAATTITDAVGLSTTTVNYDGSAPCGLEMLFKVNTATSVLNFYVNGKTMTLNRSFVVGDIVYINTKRGQRAIRLGGIAGTDIMASLNPASTFLQLDRPSNTLRAYGSATGDGKVVMTSIGYQSAWWGI